MQKYEKVTLSAVVKNSIPQPGVFSEENIERFKTFSQVMLGVLTAAGLTTVLFVAPNALQALHAFQKHKKRSSGSRKQQKEKLIKTFYYFKKKGYIQLTKKGSDFEVEVTSRGKEYYSKSLGRIPQILKTSQWDKKFWQVAADIPTEHRVAADLFRRKVKELKLWGLQRTLWYYPFDIRDAIGSIAQEYGIDQYVTVMKVELFDPQDYQVLVAHFKEHRVI